MCVCAYINKEKNPLHLTPVQLQHPLKQDLVSYSKFSFQHNQSHEQMCFAPPPITLTDGDTLLNRKDHQDPLLVFIQAFKYQSQSFCSLITILLPSICLTFRILLVFYLDVWVTSRLCKDLIPVAGSWQTLIGLFENFSICVWTLGAVNTQCTCCIYPNGGNLVSEHADVSA